MQYNSTCYVYEVGYWIDKSKGIFKRKEFLAHGLLNIIREKRLNKGIFKSAYLYDSTNQNESLLYGDLYFDFDSDDFEKTRQDTIKAISFLKIVFFINDISQIKIYFSGNKGFHVIVDSEILGIKPHKYLNVAFKHIAESLNTFINNKTLDLRVYDSKRLFRIENSIHEKTGLYKTYITYEELLNCTEDQIKSKASSTSSDPCINFKFNKKANDTFNIFLNEAMQKINKVTDIKSKGTLNYEPPCIKSIFENGAISGQRNNTVAILSSYLNSSGKNLKEAIKILNDWNENVNSYPLSKSEIKTTCNSIYRGQKSFGCSSIKSLSLCISEDCKFNK